MATPPRLASPTHQRVIGVPVKRKEDFRLLTVRGTYAADVRVPGLLHAAVLRSPHSRARVRSLDLAPALEAPGVRAVLGPDEAAARLRTWLIAAAPVTLNVAGPRASEDPGIGERVAALLRTVLRRSPGEQ